MCGRFVIEGAPRPVEALLAALPPGSPPVRLGEMYPTARALVAREQNGQPASASLIWGLPRPGGKGVLINARSETVAEKPMFRRLLRHGPLVIPASGFYEWHGEGKDKEKWLFGAADGGLIWLAGLWGTFRQATGEEADCFVILTTAADAVVAPYHARMPVLVPPARVRAWLAPLLALGSSPAGAEVRQPGAAGADPQPTPLSPPVCPGGQAQAEPVALVARRVE